MKKSDNLLKDYVSRLTTEELRFICFRLDQRIGSDLSDALNIISKNVDVDKWLQTARNGEEFYDMVDTIFEYADREIGKRPIHA